MRYTAPPTKSRYVITFLTPVRYAEPLLHVVLKQARPFIFYRWARFYLDMAADTSSKRTSIQAQLATAETLCRERGKRLTPIRRQVLQILLEQGRSVKAYELLDEIRRIHPGAAPPTVYRALDFLIEEGLIHRLDAVNAWSACLDAGGEPHDLLVICTGCGAVAEFSDPALSKQLARKVAAAGFVLGHHETELRALCNACHAQAHGETRSAHEHRH